MKTTRREFLEAAAVGPLLLGLQNKSGSKAPVTQVAAEPVFQLSPFHESLPFSPGPGMVQKRHARLPDFAS